MKEKKHPLKNVSLFRVPRAKEEHFITSDWIYWLCFPQLCGHILQQGPIWGDGGRAGAGAEERSYRKKLFGGEVEEKRWRGQRRSSLVGRWVKPDREWLDFFFVCFRGGDVAGEEGVQGEKREGRGRRRSGREASGTEKGTITQAWLLPQWGRWSCSLRQNMVEASSKAGFVPESGAIEPTFKSPAEHLPCPVRAKVNWH